MTKTDRKLIYINGDWIIAIKVPASAYGDKGADVWSEPQTTAYLCKVGEENAVADLPPAPAVDAERD